VRVDHYLLKFHFSLQQINKGLLRSRPRDGAFSAYSTLFQRAHRQRVRKVKKCVRSRSISTLVAHIFRVWSLLALGALAFSLCDFGFQVERTPLEPRITKHAIHSRASYAPFILTLGELAHAPVPRGGQWKSRVRCCKRRLDGACMYVGSSVQWVPRDAVSSEEFRNLMQDWK